MKKFIFYVVVLAGLISSYNAYAIDEQEKAFKDQYESLNKQIADANQRIVGIRNERVDQLPNVIAGNKTRDNELIAEFKVLDGKVKTWTAEKEDLKKTVMEKYGKLPKWWTEPDKKK